MFPGQGVTISGQRNHKDSPAIRVRKSRSERRGGVTGNVPDPPEPVAVVSLVAEHGQGAKIRNETDKHHRNTIIRYFYKQL